MSMALLDKIFRRDVERNKDTGNFLTRYVKSFFHAIDGILYCLKNEHNMIIILTATIVATILGIIYEVASYEWLFIILVCGAIAACELINSSIEATIDLITLETHPLAKIAKDTVSGASLILCIVAFIGALIIFLPKMGVIL